MNSGSIVLTPWRTFRWTRMRDGEIAGGLFDEHDRPVPGTYGWWRTNDQDEAARLCRVINGITWTDDRWTAQPRESYEVQP